MSTQPRRVLRGSDRGSAGVLGAGNPAVTPAAEAEQTATPQPVTEPIDADALSPLLYTPTQAAELLAVRESWLRRMAGRRAIPCTFLGKHLRFSERDLRGIVESSAQQVRRIRGFRRQ